ncbi:MAG: adhesin OmpL37 family surface protein [Leptospira bouyouniensis]
MRTFLFYVLGGLCLFWGSRTHSNGNLQVAFGAEENYLLVRSLDASVIHFGTAEEKVEYRDIIDEYLKFKSLHIQGKYGDAYLAVRSTQFKLIQLYDKILTKNITLVRSELELLGRKSRDKEKTQTKAFLRLALRDVSEAEQKLVMARNMRPYLYLLKLREMLFALKILKHAGKFVIFLNLLHDGQFMDSIEFYNFDSIESELIRGFGKNSKLLAMHNDNAFLPFGEESIYEDKMTNFKIQTINQNETLK